MTGPGRPVEGEVHLAPARPRRSLARVVVYGLLAALVLVVARDATVWPLSEWRLFSELRTPRATSVAVVMESPAPDRQLDTTTLWPEYRSLGHAIAIARVGGPDDLAELCEVLLDEVALESPMVTGLRVERRMTDSSGGGDPELLDRSVLARCAR